MQANAVPLLGLQDTLPQLFAGVIQPALHRAFGALQGLGDLGHGKLGIVKQQHTLFLLLGQRLDDGEDDLPLGPVFQGGGGNEALVLLGQLVQHGIAVLILRQLGVPPRLAQYIAALVGGNLKQPPLKGVGVGQIGQGPEGGQKGLLYGVLRVLGAAGHAKGQVVDPFIHGLIKGGLGLRIALLGQPHLLNEFHKLSSLAPYHNKGKNDRQ